MLISHMQLTHTYLGHHSEHDVTVTCSVTPDAEQQVGLELRCVTRLCSSQSDLQLKASFQSCYHVDH
jgi:hypothetical protein